MLRRCKEDQLYTLFTIDIGVMAGRNLEEVSFGDPGFDIGLNHVNDQLSV